MDLSGIQFDTDTVTTMLAGPQGPPGPAGNAPPVVTSLPASPIDGQECYFLADSTFGVLWHLRYRAASASPYKWECVGGLPLTAEVTGQGTLASATYADIPTAPGPSLVAPLAGDYMLAGASALADNQLSATFAALVAIQIGATVPSDNDVTNQLYGVTNASGNTVSSLGSREYRRTVSAANTTIKVVARQAGGSPIVGVRSLAIRPVRVG